MWENVFSLKTILPLIWQRSCSVLAKKESYEFTVRLRHQTRASTDTLGSSGVTISWQIGIISWPRWYLIVNELYANIREDQLTLVGRQLTSQANQLISEDDQLASKQLSTIKASAYFNTAWQSVNTSEPLANIKSFQFYVRIGKSAIGGYTQEACISCAEKLILDTTQNMYRILCSNTVVTVQ